MPFSKMSAPKTNRGTLSRWLPALNILLLLVAAVFSLIWYYRVKDMTVSLPDYTQTVVGWLVAITGLITWVSGISWGAQYVINRLRQQPEPKKLTREQVMQKYLPFVVDRIFHPLLHSVWSAIGLFVCSGLLA